MSLVRDPLAHTGQRVTKEGRALVDSKNISRIGHVAQDEAGSYACYVRHTVQAAATSEWVGWIQNDSDTDFVVSKIILSGGDVGGDTATFKHELFFATSSEYTSGGTAFTPLNTNRGSGNAASLTVYNNDSNDLVLDSAVDNSREFIDFRTANGGGTHILDTGDSIILAKNTAIAIKCESSSLGEKIRATVWGYFAETDFD